MSQTHMTKSIRFLHTLLKKYIEFSFDIEKNDQIIKSLEPPYLIVGNHQNNWDGFLMNIYVDEPISFVVSDEQFRNPFLRALLKYIHAIPTIKAKSDITTIKQMMRAKKEKRILGLFPEGNRTWDGKTQPIYYSTAKLIKLLKIPVVVAKFKGGHLIAPRWAKKRRKGKWFVDYDLLFSLEQIEQDSVDEIFQKLVQALDHDEFAWQKEQMLPYKGEKLAEKLEYFLFTCPHCHTMDQLKSTGNDFSCNHCGYTVEYTEYGFFEKKSSESVSKDMGTEKLYFNNPRDWDQWQVAQLDTLLKQSSKDYLMTGDNVILKQGDRYKPLKEISAGQLLVDYNNFYYRTLNSELIIPFNKIDGLNLQVRNQLDIYFDDQLFRFTFRKSNQSPYKWLKIIEILQSNIKSQRNSM